MVSLSKEKLKEIAEELELGIGIPYVHKKTGEVKCTLDPDNSFLMEEEWEEEFKEIQENIEDYIKIDPVPSYEGFKIMERFANGVESDEIRRRLFSALNQRKPFRRFKDVLIDYESLEKEYYAYKLDQYIEWVKDQLPVE